MKTILEKGTGVSVYVFDNSKSITLRVNSIIVGNPTEYIIWDMNQNNAEIIMEVTPPSDWESRKYKFIIPPGTSSASGAWILNDEWETWNNIQDQDIQDLIDSKLNISEFTSNNILSKILTVDGPGSGIDADTLDGYDSTYFLPASSYTPTDIFNKILTIDGTGSGLDADVLDGRHGSYYLDPSNLSSIIPVNKLSGTYAIDVEGTACTASVLESARTISLSGDANGHTVFDGSSDVDIAVAISQFNTNINANYNRLINLDDPISLNDAANKKYVDDLVKNIIQLLDRGRTYYVDIEGTDDIICGRTPATPFKTVKYACERVDADQRAAYIDAGYATSNADIDFLMASGTYFPFRAAIHASVGTYSEQLPIIVPPYTSIVGDTQRATVFTPADGLSDDGITLNKNSTMFKMSNGTLAIKFLISGMTGWNNEANVSFDASTDTIILPNHGFSNGDLIRIVSANTAVGDFENKHVYVINGSSNTDIFQISTSIEGDAIAFTANGEGVIEDSDLSRTVPAGIGFALNPNSPITSTSPYILECAFISLPSNGGGKAIGAYIDGKAEKDARFGGGVQTLGTHSLLFHAYTNIVDDGCAFWGDNGGIVELVSCFTYYCKYGYAATRGGYIRSLNGSNSWGVRALYSAGYLADEIPITGTLLGEQFYYQLIEPANTDIELVSGDYIIDELGAVGTLISNQTLENKLLYIPVLGQFVYDEEDLSPFSIYSNTDIIIVSNTEFEIESGASPKATGLIRANATSTHEPVSFQRGRSLAIFNLQKLNPATGEYDPFSDILKNGASITVDDIIGYDGANNAIKEEHSYVIQSIKEAGTSIAEEYDAGSNTTIEFDSTVYVLGLVNDKAFESDPGTTTTMRYKFSQVRCSGHDLLNIGTTNMFNTNLYDIDRDSYIANSELEVTETSPGRVFYVTTDQDGNFKVGNYFSVNQGTGQIYLDASVFELASVESFEVGILTIGDTQPVSGISTSITLEENSNVLLSTQKAIKTYVDNQIVWVDNKNLDYQPSNNYSINITGNANTATAFETPRYIQLFGDATGEALFDGTSNAEITISANYGPNLLVGRDISQDIYRDNGILVNWNNTPLSTVAEYTAIGSSHMVNAVLVSETEYIPVIGDVIEISGAIGTQEAKLNGRWNVTDVVSDGSNTLVEFVTSEILSAGSYTSNIGDIYIAHTGYFGINSYNGHFDYIPNTIKNVSYDAELGEVTSYTGNRGTVNADIISNTINANTIAAAVEIITGTLTASSGIINNDLQIDGNLIVKGDTVQVEVTAMVIEDPIITIGGFETANTETGNTEIVIIDEGRRGIQFWYGNSDVPERGFFGYEPTTDTFRFIPDTETRDPETNEKLDLKGTIEAHIEWEDVLNTPNTWIRFSDGIHTAIPDQANDIFTFAAGGALTVNVNSVIDSVVYAHYNPSTTNLTEGYRTYVTGLTYDDYGHIIDYTTNSEHILDTTYVLNVLQSIGSNNNVRIELAGSDGNVNSSDIVTVEGADNIIIQKVGETVRISAPDVDTTIHNDTTNVTQYLISARATSGAFTDAYVSNTNCYFNPNTGVITATDFDSLSDASLKENVLELHNSIEVLDQMVPVEFTWKNNGEKGYGMIAQEVEKVLPSIVNESKGIKSVSYTQIIPFLIDAVKNQQKEIDRLKEIIKNLI